MAKRLQETNEDRWRRKIKDYEEKLSKPKRRRIIIYSSSDTSGDEADDVQIEEHLNIENTEAEVYEYNEDGVEEELSTNSPVLVDQPHEAATRSTATSPPPSAPPASVPEPAVDPDLLLALGDSFADTPEWGDDILADISQRWEPIFKAGLTKEVKDDLLKKYLFPKNTPLVKPPTLNPEISAMLTEACRNRDSRVCTKQAQIGRAIAALGKVMTGILTKSMQNSDVIRTLNDAGKLLADSHYLETDTRRSLITPLLDKSYVTPFKDRQRDNFLFGQNLGEFIKSSRGIKKTGQMIAPPAPSTSSANLNWTGPSHLHRTNRPPIQRSGGQRGARSARPPPPATRRAPPAQPPPAPRRAPAPARRPAPASTSRSRRTT